MDLNVISWHQENNKILSQTHKSDCFRDFARMLFELSTLPTHTYGNEYRILVMHNLLRLVPEMGFCIEQFLLSRENFEVRKK